MREGPAAEAGALEFDKIDLDLNPARSCPARGPADLKAAASAAGPPELNWGSQLAFISFEDLLSISFI